MPGPAYVIGDSPGQASGLISGYTQQAASDYWNAVNARRADQQMAQQWALQEADAVNKNAALAWNRYDRNNPDPVTRQQMSLAQGDYDMRQRLNQRTLNEPTGQQLRLDAKRDELAAKEEAFLFQDAQFQADRGIFGDMQELSKAYPLFNDAQKAALLRVSLVKRRELQMKDQELSALSETLNRQAAQKKLEEKMVQGAALSMDNNWWRGDKWAFGDRPPRVLPENMTALAPGIANDARIATDFPYLAKHRASMVGLNASAERVRGMDNINEITHDDPISGLRVPSIRYSPVALAPGAGQAPAGSPLAPGGKIPTVRTQEDYVLIPVGAFYFDAVGNKRQKK